MIVDYVRKQGKEYHKIHEGHQLKLFNTPLLAAG
jgi:hypothetical protein